ncbi:MAG: site-2 protease family protein [Methylomonas sp.]|jgi:Zn-dependent protease
MDDLSLVQRVVVWLLPVVFAITVHEAAHGWVARQFGDNTAYLQGRLTLNPFKHVDLFGTIILPVIMLISFTGFIFGWAKPVPIDPRHFKKPRQAMMLVALAGPVSNFLMAFFWAMLARFGVMYHEYEFASLPMVYMGAAGIHINLILALLNMLPIPPLDGSRVLSGLLPSYWAWKYNSLERYGFIILLVLLVSNALGFILEYPLYHLTQVFFSLAGM